MRVAMLRKVFYTEQDMEMKRTIQLAHNERVVSVLHAEWPHTYTVLVGEELNLPPTEAEQAESLRLITEGWGRARSMVPTLVPCSVSPPRRWWRR